MRLDIRLPIGLLFGSIGVLLIGWGFVSDPGIYARSLGININLWWGLCLVAFGAVMLGLSWLGAKKPAGDTAAKPDGDGPRVAMH